jgi:hypothetical protein
MWVVAKPMSFQNSGHFVELRRGLKDRDIALAIQELVLHFHNKAIQCIDLRNLCCPFCFQGGHDFLCNLNIVLHLVDVMQKGAVSSDQICCT